MADVPGAPVPACRCPFTGAPTSMRCGQHRSDIDALRVPKDDLSWCKVFRILPWPGGRGRTTVGGMREYRFGVALIVVLVGCNSRESVPERASPREVAAQRRRAHLDDPARAASWLRDNLDRASTVVGYVIDPSIPDAPVAQRLSRTDAGLEAFHGYPIRARFDLAAADHAALRAALLTSVDGGARIEGDGRPACFLPHHALHVVVAAGAFDLLVCFECVQLEIWDGTGELANLVIDRSAQATFERMLPDPSLGERR